MAKQFRFGGLEKVVGESPTIGLDRGSVQDSSMWWVCDDLNFVSFQVSRKFPHEHIVGVGYPQRRRKHPRPKGTGLLKKVLYSDNDLKRFNF